MAKNQLQERSQRASNLKVYQINDDAFFVDSSEGKICYRVILSDEITNCTCGDYSRNSKADAEFKCKHILAVFNAIPTGDINTANLLRKKLPKLDERFIMTLEGKDFVKYPGLLDLGHQKGLSSIEVEILQTPNKDNGSFAICKATVIAKNGDTFTDIGDASPQNCNSKVVKHLLRMASTRSIARALRSFTNIGMTCLEELGDFDEVLGENGSKGRKRAENVTFAKPKVVPKQAQQNQQNQPSQPSQQAQAPADQPVNAQVESPAQENSSPAVNDQPPAPAASAAPAKPQPVRERKPADQAPSSPKKANGNNGKAAASNQTDAKADEVIMSSAQKSAIYNLARRRSISVADLEKMAEESFGVGVDYLTRENASMFIRHLQQAA
jgi:hypothetical protein